MTDYKEFFDNLKTDEMPVMDKILKKIEGYIEVERVSDEEALDESNHISFSLKIKEFKDSLIKISSTKDDSDISETEVYSYINGDWVNILFNNSLYLKYYGKSYFKNDNKWRKAITFGSLLDGKVNGDNLIDIINLYISKKLNFHNDEMYVYDRIRVNDMSEIDHLDDLVYHKDVSFTEPDEFKYVCKASSLFSLKDIDKYIHELSVELLGTNNSAINNKIMGIDKEYINYRKVLVLIAEINVNKPFFRDIFQRYFQIFNDYNNLEYTLTSLINRISDIVYFINQYEDYLRRALFNDQVSYEGIYFHKDTHYAKINSFMRDMTDNNGVVYKIVASNDAYNMYRSGMSAGSMKKITRGMSEKIKKFSHLEKGYIPAEIVLRKIGGKDLYKLIGMLDGNDNIIPFNNPLHLMEIFRLDNIKQTTPDLLVIGEYIEKGNVKNVIKCRN